MAGGGAKTFWSMGVLRAFADLLPPTDHVAGVSAGAAMSVVQVSGRVDECLRYFLDATGRNQRNFYPRRALRGDSPFPHEDILKATMRHALRDGGFAAIRRGPPIHILMSSIPAGRPPFLTGVAALRAFERRSRSGRLHGPTEPPAGLTERVVSSHAAMDPEQLVEWIAWSSSTPPITRFPKQAGRRYLDGALIDNIPIRALPEPARRGRMLVLLCSPTRVARRPLRTAEGGRILYLAPADPLPAGMWDFTSPERVFETWELGQREGTVLRARFEALLEHRA